MTMHNRSDAGSTWTGRTPEGTPQPPVDDDIEDTWGGF